MGQIKKTLGKVPVGRGAYSATETYYKENTVQMYGMSFRALSDMRGVAPASINSFGKVTLANTDKWELISGSVDTYNNAKDMQNLGNKVGMLEERIDNIKPVQIMGDVTNAADEEDLTTDGNLLKLKDRSNINGMGYVILRQNKTFAEQVTLANTIYEIRYDFDLDGAEVEIPENCVLKFEGGSLSNGAVVGDNTDIEANVYHILKNITIQGTYNVLEAYPEWFGAKGDGETDDRFTFIDAFKVSKILHLKSSTTYAINCDRDDIISNARTGIVVPSGGIILGNHATLQALTSTYAGFNVVYVLNSDNVLIENLNIIGDKDTHTNLTTENQEGIHIRSSHHVSVRNCNIYKLMGDGICIGDWESTTYDNPPTDITISNVFITDCTRNGIAIIAGERIYIYDSVINNIDGAPMGPWACIDIEPNSAVQSVKDVIVSGCDFNNIKAIAVDANNGVDTLSNITFSNCNLRGLCGLRLTTGTNSVIITNCITGQISINNKSASSIIITDSTIIKNHDTSGIVFVSAIAGSSTLIKNITVDSTTTTSAATGTVPIHLAGTEILHNITMENVYIAGGNLYNIMLKESQLDTSCAFLNVKYNGSIAETNPMQYFTERIKKDIHGKERKGYDGIRLSIYERYVFSELTSGASMYTSRNMSDGWHTIINNSEHNVYIEPTSDVKILHNGEIINTRITISSGKTARLLYDTLSELAIYYTDDTSAKSGEIRPTYNITQGQLFYDKTLGKPIWWNGTEWVDANGTQV